MKKNFDSWFRWLLVIILVINLFAMMSVELIGQVMASAPAALNPQTQTDATLRVLVPPGAVSVGQEITVDIEINTREETRGLSFGLSFNPSVLRLEEIIEGTFYSNWAAANGALRVFNRGAINNSTGRVGDSYITLLGGFTPTPFPPAIPTPTLGPYVPGPTGQGVVMRFRFTALANGTSSIEIVDPIVAGNRAQNPQSLSLTVINGQVIVGPTPAVTLTPSLTPTVTRSPTPSPTRTPTRTPYPTADLAVLCPSVDFNADGFVDLLDIQQLINKIGQTGPAGWIAEDVNRDGIVNISDLTLMGNCLGWSLTPINTPAPGTAILRISPLQQTVKTGQTVVVDILMDVSTYSSGAQAGLRFDPSLLRCDRVEEGDFYRGWVNAYYPGATTLKMPEPQCDNNNGRVTVGGIYLNGVPPGDGPRGTGSLWRVRFTALRTGTSVLELMDGVVRDTSVPISRSLPVTMRNGTVNLQPGGPNVSLRVQPAQFQNLEVNQTITFTIDISSDTPTRGAQVGLSFDPRLLNCTSVSEGEFYKNWANANGARTVFYPPGRIDNTYGIIDAAVVSVIGGSGGATGSGSLLSITCRVIGRQGNSSLSLLNWVVTDDSPDPVTLPVQIFNGWIGTILVPTPTPTATSSPTSTQVAGRLFLDPASPIVRPNVEFNLDLRIDIPVASAGMQFEASFDKTILQCVNIERGSFYDNWVQANPSFNAVVVDVPGLPVCDNANGKIRLGGVGMLGNPNGRGPSGSGVVYRLRFKGLTTGNASITLSNVLVSDALVVSSGGNETTNPIPVAISGAQVTVSTTAASITPTLQTTANATQVLQTQTAAMMQTQTATMQIQTLTAGVALTQTKAAEYTLAARGGQRAGTAVPTATMIPANGSLSVNPPQIIRSSAGDEVFNVDIVLTIDKPSRAIQFKVKYDPSVLSCVKITEGSFYKDYAKTIPGGQTMMIPAPRCDDAAGSTSFIGITVLGAANTPDPITRSVGGAKGSGVVVTVQFKAKKVGSSPLQLTDVIIADDRDQNVGSYNLPIVNGNVYVGVTPPPQSGTTVVATQLLTPNRTNQLTGTPMLSGTPTVSGTPPTLTATSSAVSGIPTEVGLKPTTSTVEKPISGGPTYAFDVSNLIDDSGILLEDLEITSEDGLLILRLEKGTQMLTAENRRLKEITIRRLDSFPDPSGNLRSLNLAYELGPEGASFDPPASLTLYYGRYGLPEGIKVNNLILTRYDSSKKQWISLKGKINEQDETLSTQIEYFSIYSLMARQAVIPRQWWIGGIILLEILIAAGVIIYFRRRQKEKILKTSTSSGESSIPNNSQSAESTADLSNPKYSDNNTP